jgi:polyisoprenoid-binding protein YceI
MVHRLAAAAIALCLLLPATASAGWSVNGTPKVTFYAQGHPGAMSIEGKAARTAVADEDQGLRFTVAMDDVTTGIALRDEHMNKTYVQTDQFPDAVLVVPKAALQIPTDIGSSTTGHVPGFFTAHGQTREVAVAYEIKRDKNGLQVRGSFPFDVTQHGILIPSYLGVTIDPVMHAEANFRVAETP